jgi:hypothetical protein
MENTNSSTASSTKTSSSWTETCGLGGILLIAAGAVVAGISFAAEVGSELFRSLFGDD